MYTCNPVYLDIGREHFRDVKLENPFCIATGSKNTLLRSERKIKVELIRPLVNVTVVQPRVRVLCIGTLQGTCDRGRGCALRVRVKQSRAALCASAWHGGTRRGRESVADLTDAGSPTNSHVWMWHQ